MDGQSAETKKAPAFRGLSRKIKGEIDGLSNPFRPFRPSRRRARGAIPGCLSPPVAIT
jgi:hypothetical protein